MKMLWSGIMLLVLMVNAVSAEFRPSERREVSSIHSLPNGNPSSTPKRGRQRNGFRIHRIAVVGSSILAAKTLIGLCGLKAGGIATEEDLAKADQRLRRAVVQTGHILADVSITRYPSTTLDNNGPSFDLTMSIDEGPLFLIQKIDFVGNKYTRDSVIWRAVGLHAGEIYNPIRVNQARRRLNRLGRFRNVEETDVKVQINKEDASVYLTFQLREKSLRHTTLVPGKDR